MAEQAPPQKQPRRKLWTYSIVAAVIIAALITAFFLLQARDKQAKAEKDTHKQTSQSINIGIPINDSPGFSSMKDGQRNGFDIDLANFIADGLKRHPNFVPITVGSREQQLKKGYIDLSISTYSISDKRIQEGIIFAGPYLRTDQGILVNASNTTIATIDDLKGETVCVTKGSTSDDKLKELNKNVPLVILERDTFTQCLDDLKNPSTNVRAITNDTIILQGHANADSSLKVVPNVVIPGTYEKYGIGMAKSDITLCGEVTALLKEFVTKQWNPAFTANFTLTNGQSSTSLKPDPSTIDTESCRTQ